MKYRSIKSIHKRSGDASIGWEQMEWGINEQINKQHINKLISTCMIYTVIKYVDYTPNYSCLNHIVTGRTNSKNTSQTTTTWKKTNQYTGQKIHYPRKLHAKQTETNSCTFISIQPESSIFLRLHVGVTFTEIVGKVWTSRWSYRIHIEFQ